MLLATNMASYGVLVIDCASQLPDQMSSPLESGKPRRRGPGFDTVVMNPPFGTRNRGIDVLFLQHAIKSVVDGGAVYSLHKSTTREHLYSAATAMVCRPPKPYHSRHMTANSSPSLTAPCASLTRTIAVRSCCVLLRAPSQSLSQSCVSTFLPCTCSTRRRAKTWRCAKTFPGEPPQTRC